MRKQWSDAPQTWAAEACRQGRRRHLALPPTGSSVLKVPSVLLVEQLVHQLGVHDSLPRRGSRRESALAGRPWLPG